MELKLHEQKILEQRINKPGQIGVIGKVVLTDGTVFTDIPLAYETSSEMLTLSDGTLSFIQGKYGVLLSPADINHITFPDPREDEFQPSILQIETTTRCNLHCIFCVGRTFEQEKMSLHDFKTILDRFSYQLQEIILQGEGEPFLYDDIFRMIAMAKAKAQKLSSISNGHLLDRVGGRIIDSDIDELGFSLESIEPEKFSRLRAGGNFAKF
ncbi:MAG: Radical SAM protein, partial [uncultured bacterium]